MASEIPNSTADPIAYITVVPTGEFAFQKIEIDEVKKKKLLRKLDDKKATGLDKIPGKRLNIGDIVASSLTNIFNTSLAMGIGSRLEYHRYLRRAPNLTQITIALQHLFYL